MWCSFNHSFNHYPLMFNNTFLANTRNKSLSKWLHTDWLNRTIYQCLVGSWCYNILILCMILGSAQSKLASSWQICRFQRKVQFLLPPTLLVLPATVKHLDCAVTCRLHCTLQPHLPSYKVYNLVCYRSRAFTEWQQLVKVAWIWVSWSGDVANNYSRQWN